MAGLMGQFSTVIRKTKALVGRPICYLRKPKQHKAPLGQQASCALLSLRHETSQNV